MCIDIKDKSVILNGVAMRVMARKAAISVHRRNLVAAIFNSICSFLQGFGIVVGIILEVIRSLTCLAKAISDLAHAARQSSLAIVGNNRPALGLVA
jgi:hypothetical protein